MQPDKLYLMRVRLLTRMEEEPDQSKKSSMLVKIQAIEKRRKNND